MASDKKQKLALTVAAIRAQWGTRSIHQGDDQALAAPTAVATSFPQLDEAIGIGGLPRRRITEIIGQPTSGMATLALKTMAEAQKEKGTAVYIDTEHTFDPVYAARCGADLDRLVVVRPASSQQGLAILRDFVLIGRLNIAVFDVPAHQLAKAAAAQALAATLDHIIAPLGKSNMALLFLTSLATGSQELRAYPPAVTLPHYTAVRLLLQRQRWLYRDRDIHGYEARLLIVKNKLGPAGQQVPIRITFNGIVGAMPGEGSPV